MTPLSPYSSPTLESKSICLLIAKKKEKKKEEGIKNNTVNVMFLNSSKHCTSIVPKTRSAIAPSDLNTWKWKSSPQKLEKAASHDIWINVRFISLYHSDFTVYVLGCWVVYVCVLRLQYCAKVSSHALFIYILLSKDADLLVHFYSYPEQ